jgi:sulfite exporter TauE/SafE/copper chaperone CopZ
MNKYNYHISGLHCSSCVLVIEDRLEKESGIKSVNVNLKKELINLESQKIISPSTLNQIFKKNNYHFSEINLDEDANTVTLNLGSLWWLWAILIIGAFLLLSQFGLASFLNINSNSSLVSFFVFGLIAGFSSCGALLSGIILSNPQNTKLILLGRIVSYSILGGILGIIGQKFIVSPALTSILVILVSLIMALVGFQMLNFKFARQINFSLPKKFTKKIIQTKLPIIIGFLTVFLPCGFTLMTEGVAVLSGNFTHGFLIMLVFVLGTSIPLFLIGISSDKLIKNQKLIGILILFFVLYNLNFQFGFTQKIFNQNNYVDSSSNSVTTEVTPTPLKDAKLITATYSQLTDIVPNSFTLKVGEPVRFEITANDNGSGCMSTVMIPGLYSKPQPLIKGQKIVMEFVPDKVGTYQITCAMGVPRGEINVVQ